MVTDILIVGCGAGGLYTALKLPKDKKVTIITKDKAERSDSFLAQGGICVLHDDEDYDSFYEDTMRAGHYENKPESVDIMISSSRETINTLVSFGVRFEKDGDDFAYTREGAHSKPRILFHQDETGKEITSKLLAEVRRRDNITLIEEYTMLDLICNGNTCLGVIGKDKDGELSFISAHYTVLATGGIGGLFIHSTNYKHLTGDALALALKYDIKLRDIDYIQIHPTTLYTKNSGREFLISESVRGEGALLYSVNGERFIDELLPRDVVANAIFEQMKKDGSDYVLLSLEKIEEEDIRSHFPNIYERCLKEGHDITREPIPVVPSQHYFMGGIEVDSNSRTSMERLYAVGETSCNGVHGRNRLASNSLLETLVFAGRAAAHMAGEYTETVLPVPVIDPSRYENYEAEYKEAVLSAIEKEKKKNG